MTNGWHPKKTKYKVVGRRKTKKSETGAVSKKKASRRATG
jgi:hypothetical protein